MKSEMRKKPKEETFIPKEKCVIFLFCLQSCLTKCWNCIFGYVKALKMLQVNVGCHCNTMYQKKCLHGAFHTPRVHNS